MGAIKFLTNPRFDADENLLIRIAHAIVTSRLLFGSVVYFGSAKSNIKNLNSTYTGALRHAIDAFRTSPLVSVIFESGQLSFDHQVKQKSLKYAMKTLSAQHLSNKGLIEACDYQSLRTLGDLFKQEIVKLNINLSEVHDTQPCPPPWWFNQANIDIELSRCKKDTLPTITLRRLANSKIQRLNNNHIFFTDGSRDLGKTGYAIVQPTGVIKGRLQNHCSVYTAELTAILRAAQIASTLQGKATIISDSLSSLKAIMRPSSQDAIVLKIQNEICKNKDKISLLFVHSHIGVEGNEDADRQAKSALDFPEPTDPSNSLPDLKRLVKSFIYKNRQNDWESLDQTNKLRSHVPTLTTRSQYIIGHRKKDTTISRLRIGHSNLTHSFLFEMPHTPPMCLNCNIQITIDHILTVCPEYQAIRLPWILT